jgi:hypothetical protein
MTRSSLKTLLLWDFGKFGLLAFSIIFGDHGKLQYHFAIFPYISGPTWGGGKAKHSIEK